MGEQEAYARYKTFGTERLEKITEWIYRVHKSSGNSMVENDGEIAQEDW